MGIDTQEHIRAFVAVEMPDKIRDELSRLQSKLQQSCGFCPAKWVTPASIHLTLQFLGNVPLSKIGGIKNALTKLSSFYNAFEVTLAGLGVFPGIHSPRVVWVGLGGDLEQLSKIQKHLEQLLAESGFNPETRPFSPHLTLARIRDEASSADRQKLGQVISSMTYKPGCKIPVRSISLIKSQLTPSGPIYTVLSSADFKPES